MSCNLSHDIKMPDPDCKSPLNPITKAILIVPEDIILTDESTMNESVKFVPIPSSQIPSEPVFTMKDNKSFIDWCRAGSIIHRAQQNTAK